MFNMSEELIPSIFAEKLVKNNHFCVINDQIIIFFIFYLKSKR